MSKKQTKNAFKVMVEAFWSGALKNFDLPTNRVDRRKLTVDEIKEYIKEEFGKAKKAKDVESKLAPKGWGDTELENEVNWIKSLNIKEFFNLANKKKQEKKE